MHMKHLRKYNESIRSKKDIYAICNEYDIENYTINNDGTIDVDGSVYYLYNESLDELPLKFNNVSGNFDCSYNQLTTLEGSPISVGSENPIFEIWKLFKDYSKVELFNDYDPIRGDTIILDRLNSFLEDIGKKPVTEVKGYK